MGSGHLSKTFCICNKYLPFCFLLSGLSCPWGKYSIGKFCLNKPGELFIYLVAFHKNFKKLARKQYTKCEDMRVEFRTYQLFSAEILDLSGSVFLFNVSILVTTKKLVTTKQLMTGLVGVQSSNHFSKCYKFLYLLEKSKQLFYCCPVTVGPTLPPKIWSGCGDRGYHTNTIIETCVGYINRVGERAGHALNVV